VVVVSAAAVVGASLEAAAVVEALLLEELPHAAATSVNETRPATTSRCLGVFT
jgi:hypothetical protein